MSKKPNGNRYSLDERLSRLRRFDFYLSHGVSVENAAREAGASIATLYRWRHQFHSNPVENRDHARITKTIGTLLDASVALANRRTAIFEFSVWVRWPANVADHDTAVMLLSCSYFAKRFGATRLSELSAEILIEVAGSISMPAIAALGRFDFEMPDLTPITFPGKTYTIHDVLTRIAHYYLASARPSQTSAFQALRNKALSYQWDVSRRTFDKTWRKHAATMPFLYVDGFHFDLNWHLDPESIDFVSDVDALSDSFCPVVDYFERCAWANERFRDLLNRDSATRKLLLNLPESLSPLSCDIPQFSRQSQLASQRPTSENTIGELERDILQDKQNEINNLNEVNKLLKRQ